MPHNKHSTKRLKILGRMLLAVLAMAVIPGGLQAQQVSEIEVAVPDSSHSELLENQNSGQLDQIRRSVKPFGHSLFTGGFGHSENNGLNADYLVSTGDRISIRIWGATSFESVQVVDTQGNIFIPDVGPVSLGGVPNRSVNSTVKSAIAKVYTNDVEVYTNLLTAQSAGVYVTGFVQRPGKYAGVPSSSVLDFIDKAGGIDADSGSFRHIEILRKSKIIATVDLYEFIQAGQIPEIVFKEGDTIVVRPLMNTVYAQGEVVKPFRFEFSEQGILGRDIVALSGPRAGVTHAAISQVSNGQSVFEYVTLDEFSQMNIGDGDVVSFKSDLREKNITINIGGSFNGPSAITVSRTATLRQVLDLIEVDASLSAYESIFIKRKSIAERQKISIKESLRRLESEFLTASSSTDGESKIRAQEAQLISDFVNKGSLAEPQGTLVVVQKNGVADIILQNDDTIFIPRKSPSVLITGEVRLPRAFLWQSGQTSQDYIAQAGGFSNNANRESVLLVKQDGRVIDTKSANVEAGDELLILPKAPTKNIQLATSISDILFQIAVATRVALNL